MAKRKKTRRSRGLGGTPAEHTQKARQAALAARKYLLKAQKMMGRSCEVATESMFTGLTYSGMAQAHLEEASFDARGSSEAIRGLKEVTRTTMGLHKDLCRSVSLEEYKSSRSR